MSIFIDDFKKLYDGVEFKIPGYLNPVRIVAWVICGTCDLCAKALFLNVQKYDGTYGCPHCQIKTKKMNNVQIYPF